MPLKNPDMDECSEKKRCWNGTNKGLIYKVGDECPSGRVFSEELCDCLIGCSGTLAQNGGPGTTVNSYYISEDTTSVTFAWEAFDIPDTFELTGAATFSTGSVSGNGFTVIPVQSGNYQITVTVTGPPDTAWEYTLTCS